MAGIAFPVSLAPPCPRPLRGGRPEVCLREGHGPAFRAGPLRDFGALIFGFHHEPKVVTETGARPGLQDPGVLRKGQLGQVEHGDEGRPRDLELNAFHASPPYTVNQCSSWT